MKRLVGSALLLTVVLAACSSFNTWNFHITTSEATPAEVRAAWPWDSSGVGQVPTDGEMLCPIYTFPDLPVVPALPIAELAKAVPANAKALDAIQQKHIEDLREYISASRKLIRFSYDKYVEDCKARHARPLK